MNNWKDLLSALESPQYTPDVETTILQLWIEESKAEDIILNHIQLRLKEGISPELLNNVFKNICNSKDLEGLGETFNNAIIGPFLHGNYVEHFHYVLHNDMRQLNFTYRKSLLDNLMFHIVHGKSVPEAINIVKGLIGKSKYTESEIYISLVYSYMNAGKRPLLPGLFEILGDKVNYELMSKTAIKDTNIFHELLRYLETSSFMSYAVTNTTDESLLAKSIMNEMSTYHLCYNLNSSKLFFKLLFETSTEKPLLWNFIIDKMFEEKQYDIIVRTAEYQPKKKILKILLEKADASVIDYFYKTYKNDPEIKTFLPFT